MSVSNPNFVWPKEYVDIPNYSFEFELNELCFLGSSVMIGGIVYPKQALIVIDRWAKKNTDIERYSNIGYMVYCQENQVYLDLPERDLIKAHFVI